MTYRLKGKNIFTAYDLIDRISTMRINSFINKYSNKTIQFESTINPACIMIIHKSTKAEVYQASFFKNNIAISDIHRNTFAELVEEIYNNYRQYKIKEVIQ